MGEIYARKLAAEGYNLILVALVQSEMDAVADDLRAAHPAAEIISLGMDLSDRNAPAEVFAAASGHNVDILINNAGMIDIRHLQDIPEARVSSTVMVHNHAMAMLTRLFLPGMLEKKGGYIMNISSITAWLPYPYITVYSATKSFVKTFTRAVRTECRGSGVSVSTIYFGAVSTPLYNLSDSTRQKAIRLGIMMTPEKAAGKALKMMFAGKSGAMPGFLNRISVFLARLVPDCAIAAIDRKVTGKAAKKR